MKLFVAVLPPPGASAELDAALAPLRLLPDADALRWTEPDGWHFTLAFLGEVGDRPLPELYERLGRAARRHSAHGLRLAGGGRFGDRALWAGVGGDRRALGRLAQSAVAAGRRTGIAVDERPFKAHLTLARSRTLRRVAAGRGERPPGEDRPGEDRPVEDRPVVDLRPYAEALAGFEGTEWTADRLSLMSSTPGPSGSPPRYGTVRSWPLGRQ